MIRLDDLALFVRTAALGSFSNAAREVDLLPGQVAAAIKRLERELDVRLFARSTRSLRLTLEGEHYLPNAQAALDTLKEGYDKLRHQSTELQGVLQLTAPSDIGRNLVLPWLSAFRGQHPRLSVRLFISDQVADMFRDPVDVALRYGVLEDANYVARPLAPWNRRVLVASPAYLSRHGRPQAPEDLQHHACLLYPLNGRAYDRWRIGAATVAVGGPLFCDDAEIVRRWAVAGEGITYKSWLDVSDDLATGRLERVMPGIPGEPLPLHFVCPHRRQFSPAVHQLYEHLKDRFTALGQVSAL